MTIAEVLKAVAAYHPDLGPDYGGCDGIKTGDPEQECTGIVTALVPTAEVIDKTAKLGANLLFVHEPTWYLTPDYPDWRAAFPCHVYEQKRRAAEDHQIVIYRDHDHMHAHRPDSIFTGVIRYMGWEPYLLKEDHTVPFGYMIEFPEPRTAEEIGRELLEKIGLNGTRYIGRPDAEIRRIALVGHLYPEAFIPSSVTNGIYTDYATEIIRVLEQENVDAILPGEIIEWNVLSYIRDAAYYGENKVCFNIGHYNWEELGARYAADWMGEITHRRVPVRYVPTGDIWNFMLRK
ncbi:Nif3-like dinuclear metal center hexameric protein [Lachnoclostridium sp. Marseille-P6806]|uniref:Nif3-like dinuclear metal center hexameric protein n=1 Tax=Lachnoclostridium sp. Marseille-P6806 TaxID=2364793 RepID=UPI001030D91B|nr:Nif3-like dinuclear metal center hexameric protein [Lachnoclostridium sp. Marseille-P6806]